MQIIKISPYGKIDDNLKYIENLTISFTLTEFCNQKCSYCVYKSRLSSKQDISESKFKEQLQMLEKLPANCCISFAGGEPSLHPYFLEIIQYSVNKFDMVRVITNGSKSLKFWESVSKLKNLDKFELAISHHIEYPNLLDHQIQIANLFPKNNISFVVMKDQKNDVSKIVSRLESLGISYDIQTLNGLNVEDSKGDKLLCITKDNQMVEKTISEIKNIPHKMWVCYMDFYMINFDLSFTTVCPYVRFKGDLKTQKVLCNREFCDSVCCSQFFKEDLRK